MQARVSGDREDREDPGAPDEGRHRQRGCTAAIRMPRSRFGPESTGSLALRFTPQRLWAAARFAGCEARLRTGRRGQAQAASAFWAWSSSIGRAAQAGGMSCLSSNSGVWWVGGEFVVSDDHAGLRQAIFDLLPEAAWQCCCVHLLRNAVDHLPRKGDGDCRTELG